jgi:peptide-methionine (R)-S-oxide reductase
MMSRRVFTLSMLAAAACAQAGGDDKHPQTPLALDPAIKDLPADPDTVTPITKTDAEWKALLDGETYDVMRQQGTEYAFSGRYWDNHSKGTYLCAACGLRLFASDDKFESGTGWPSFTRPIAEGRVQVSTDDSLGMTRDEVHCARCSGHLGHVFDDGPAPTHQRYCMNSVSLVFKSA